LLFDELMKHLTRPALYERTEAKFWNDPHISGQMLEAHLNPDTDAASRRPEFIERSAEWIASLPQNGAKLLDIGCGPGLYAKRLAERGLAVTGLDFSESSIAYAREHDPTSEYILRDYLSMDFDGAFDIVTLIYCDYGALTPEERQNLLRRVCRALRPGGLFLFDAFTSFEAAGRREDTSWHVCENGGFWSPRPHICLNAGYAYGGTAFVDRTVVVDADGIRCYNIWDTCFTKRSILDETTPAGFSERGFFGDAAGKTFTEISPTICTVLQKFA